MIIPHPLEKLQSKDVAMYAYGVSVSYAYDTRIVQIVHGSHTEGFLKSDHIFLLHYSPNYHPTSFVVGGTVCAPYSFWHFLGVGTFRT